MTEPRARCQILLLAVLLVPLGAAASVADSVNAVRARGCGGHAGGVAALHVSARLDEVARQLSRGAELRSAQRLAGYHAVSAFSVHLAAVAPSGELARRLGEQFCQQTTNPAFREFGSWRGGAELWIAFAEPFAPPASRDRVKISHRVLALVNQARGRARSCGATRFAAVAPLELNATLAHAALAYARDMASAGYMDHTGRDGSSPAERLTRSGYRWRESGENLASGIMRPEEVVAGWLHSPEHCANLMDPAFRQMGVAYAVNPRDEKGVYWALEFGTPR
jgi:uncharacterized protein YkwD